MIRNKFSAAVAANGAESFMKQPTSGRLAYIKNILLPCLIFSSVAGILTGLFVFAFKLATNRVTAWSSAIYSFVRNDPRFLPLLIGGAALAGLLAALLLYRTPHSRGGGIPTSIALLRGHMRFRWLKNLLVLFPSAMLTYLCGIPLGTEGPCVQMGTAVGCGTSRLFARNNRAWDRYIMTGGACAGFAAATGAPLTGIFFAFEEAHRRFSPMIFMTAAMSAVTGSVTMELLCDAAGISPALFGFSLDVTLPLTYLWVALVVGIVCGLCAVCLTRAFHGISRGISRVMSRLPRRLPFAVRLSAVFIITAVMGFVSADLLGSGHDLIDTVMDGRGVWYLLILYLGVRALWMIIANQVGATGGLFVPFLAFGAILGGLCGNAMIALGWLPEAYAAVPVVVGMAAFLAASSRTPITAITFAIEALSGLSNILPVAVGVTLAYLVIETAGIEDFNHAVIDGKIRAENEGRTAVVVDAAMTVRGGAFIVGKEIRDILWPPTCTVVSVQKADTSAHTPGIAVGDTLTLHYLTYDPDDTLRLLEAIVGRQDAVDGTVYRHEKGQHVPEL